MKIFFPGQRTLYKNISYVKRLPQIHQHRTGQGFHPEFYITQTCINKLLKITGRRSRRSKKAALWY
jgi:hypothetical protein